MYQRGQNCQNKIPCACQNTVYVGETWRLFQTRKKEHMDKVRLTIEDLHKGNTISAEKRMGKHGTPRSAKVMLTGGTQKS